MKKVKDIGSYEKVCRRRAAIIVAMDITKPTADVVGAKW